MRKLKIVALIILLGTVTYLSPINAIHGNDFKDRTVIVDPQPELAIGADIPLSSVELQDVSDKMFTLKSLKKGKGLLVIFASNVCPYVLANTEAMLAIAKQAEAQGIGFVLINSNEALRGEQESFQAMKEHAKKNNFTFNYLLDKDSKVADAFGATRTPQAFLFNENGLVYKGGLTDNAKNPSQAKVNYLADAMNSLIAGEEVKINSTKSIGCGIARKK